MYFVCCLLCVFVLIVLCVYCVIWLWYCMLYVIVFSIIVKIINTHKKYNIPSNSYISQNHMYIGISLYIFLFTLSFIICIYCLYCYYIIIISIIILLILWYYDIILYYYIISQSSSLLSYYQHINNIYHHTNTLTYSTTQYIIYTVFSYISLQSILSIFFPSNIFTTFIISSSSISSIL